MSCNGGVMNVSQWGLMRNSSIWACSLQSNETVRMRWHPALITSSCSRALLGNRGERQWPPSHGRTAQKTGTEWGWIPVFSLLFANTPPSQNWWFHSWGPSIKQAEQASAIWSVMSEHVGSNWQLIFHPESRNRCMLPSQSQSETSLKAPHTWAALRSMPVRLVDSRVSIEGSASQINKYLSNLRSTENKTKRKGQHTHTHTRTHARTPPAHNNSP